MVAIPPEKRQINLLWTGGWGSTFQLLRLLFEHRCEVTPHYLIAPKRRSAGIEIWTMERIRSMLFLTDPAIEERLQATRFALARNYRPDEEIRGAIQSIRKEKALAWQYAWLAKYCKVKGITDMQMCLHAEKHRLQRRFDFEQLVTEIEEGGTADYRMDATFDKKREGALFRYFTFPIMKLTKLQMSEITEKNNWGKVMGMTWFCHQPTDDMKPCGGCLPCRQTRREGLSWRFT